MDIAIVKVKENSRPCYTKEKDFSFCIIEGVPKEEKISEGIYVGKIKKIILDRYQNEIPIVDRIYQISKSNDFIETAISISEVPKYAKNFIEIAKRTELFTEYEIKLIKNILSILQIDELQTPIFDISKEEIETFPLEDLLEELEIDKKKIIKKFEKLKKEKEEELEKFYQDK